MATISQNLSSECYVLNYIQLSKIKSICSKWLIQNNSQLSKHLEPFYKYISQVDFSPVIQAYVNRLESTFPHFSKSEKISGSICFYGGVITSLLHYGCVKNIEGLFTFALCYMLIDHYLDDNTVPDKEKYRSMRQIYNFISGKSNDISNNKILKAASNRYLDLIKVSPACKIYLIKLFESELKGYVVQKNKNLDRSTYLRIAEEKGGLTSLTMASILNLKPSDDDRLLGALCQKIDDVLDIEDDARLNIYTLIRYDLDRGNIDRYIYETVCDIERLGNIYGPFKIILMLGLMLGIHTRPEAVSKELFNIVKDYIPFEKGTTKEDLIKWFYSKLYRYMDKNNL